ncbi:cobalt ECF transporter T component CbiQ [Lachnospiraceae bacterium WCA-9-b2]|uniref:Cobalt ECF transporter T component CbiQ n=1 Tax=Sporofaciens musculi TaxID=2681861 RepID=A0A7X3ML43_9FIRM|nr:cobalt ECF transporter T component CbiQ [Sporofaciens musculi]MXP78451.1 cobalt ECF transporter T component CbiQ [Sporofaciens musculi]
MSRISEAISDLHKMDMEAEKNGWLQGLHPLPKLLVTILFILLTVSFGKYDLSGLLKMGVYLIITYVLGDISIKQLLKRMKLVLAFVCLIGIWNPFFDREILFSLGNLSVTGGMISMVTLMVKGVYAVSASYLLMVTTSMEDLCYALRKIGVPKTFVTILMLVYRYIIVLLKEIERMMDGYMLRAPKQKGLHYKVWGTMIGQLLLRSMDRAQTVYDSMMLRGYNGEFHLRCKRAARRLDYLYTVGWSAALLIVRIW